MFLNNHKSNDPIIIPDPYTPKYTKLFLNESFVLKTNKELRRNESKIVMTYIKILCYN